MNSISNYETLAIIGPTACGKTRRAVEVALELEGEILSADSRQIYRHMDLGTGKDIEEYGDIPYHLIDIAEPGSKFNLYQYLTAFRATYANIKARGKFPIICGGSGMYFENALRGVILPEVPENPALRQSLQAKSLAELTEILAASKTLHNTTDVDTPKRAIRAIEIQQYYEIHPEEAKMTDYTSARPLNALIIALDIPREDRRRRISERLDARLKAGMIDEVKALLDSGIAAEDLIYYGLEYKYLTLYVTGKQSFEEMRSQLEIAIHQFAKRQMTWLRGMERRGMKLHFLPYNLPHEEFINEVKHLLNN